MSLFDVSELAVLDLLLGSGTPATLELGLSSAQPLDGGTLNELSGNGYARVTVNNNSSMWPAATLLGGVGHKKNGMSVTFPVTTGVWATVTHWFIYDSINARALLWGQIGTPPTIGIGDALRFPVNSIDVTVD
jgi:hypothetical protein